RCEGCQHVFTAEGEPGLAEAARHVVEDNGYSDKITVLPALSTELQVGYACRAEDQRRSIPCRADVLVAEIFDTGLVGEGVLPRGLGLAGRPRKAAAARRPGGATPRARLRRRLPLRVPPVAGRPRVAVLRPDRRAPQA
ncbi:unnamed protein product, partial [Prorocentrum cordatum]